MAQASGSGSGRRHEIRSRGCELFVGGLSRSVAEDTIEKLFSPYGEIQELRLMKDLNGISKGYCFVRYSSKEAAHKAIKGKDGYMLNGKKIGVALSSDQDTLFFGNLCKAWSSREFDKLVREAFKDVLSVDLAFPSTNEGTEAGRKRLNRGFAFVQFSSHAAAARAYRLASEPDFFLGDVHSAVEWAEKEPELDPEELSKIKVAFVGNLPADADEEYLRGLFEPFGKLEKVAISRKGHFPVGFVHFARRSELDDAIRKLDGKTIQAPGGGPSFQIQVTIAKPMEKDRKRIREEVTSNTGRFDIGSHTINGSRHDPSVKYISKAPKPDGMALKVVDPYEEAVISLPLAVKDRLLQIFRRGIATRYDIDIECISGLKELPVAAAIAVIDEFMLSGGTKHDKGGYFLSLIAMRQSHRSGILRPHLDYSRSSLDVPIEKSEILSHAYVRRRIGSASTRDDRQPSPPTVVLARYASPPHDPITSRTAVRVVRKRSPGYEAVPSSAVVPRSRARLDPSHSLAAEHPSERPQYKFDPFTGQPYKFDPFTGQPIQPEATSRRPGGYY